MRRAGEAERGERLGIAGCVLVLLGWSMVAAEVELPGLAGYGALPIVIGLAMLIAAVMLGRSARS